MTTWSSCATSLLFALRAPHGALRRQGAYRLLPGRRRCRPVQARPRGRCLRPAPADAGDDDVADRDHDRRGAEAARRRHHHRGRAYVHVHARRPEAGRRAPSRPSSPAFSATIRPNRPASSPWFAAYGRVSPIPFRGLTRPARIVPGRVFLCYNARSQPEPLEPGSTRPRPCPIPPPSSRSAERRPKSRKAALLMPKFDAAGLITAVAVDAVTDEVLMVAHMNEEALAPHHRERRGLVLVALARRTLAQGRHVGPDPDRRGNPRGLRPGLPAAAGRGGGRWRLLPHGPARLLLSQGRARDARRRAGPPHSGLTGSARPVAKIEL